MENSKLIRIYTDNSNQPIILSNPSTVKDAIKSIHENLLKNFKETILNGPSAKFPNQKVGLSHMLKDGDKIKIITT